MRTSILSCALFALCASASACANHGARGGAPNGDANGDANGDTNDGAIVDDAGASDDGAAGGVSDGGTPMPTRAPIVHGDYLIFPFRDGAARRRAGAAAAFRSRIRGAGLRPTARTRA